MSGRCSRSVSSRRATLQSICIADYRNDHRTHPRLSESQRHPFGRRCKAISNETLQVAGDERLGHAGERRTRTKRRRGRGCIPRTTGRRATAHDDTAAIQAAIDAIPDTATGIGPRTVIFSGGKYRISSVTLPAWGRCVIDGNGSQIFPIGNPAAVFVIPAPAATANWHTEIRNFECWDSCTDFIYIDGGNIVGLKIENIIHREGVLNSVVQFYNDSAVSAPGLWTIRKVAVPWNTATDYASHALSFTNSASGDQGWDTGLIDDIILSTSVSGASAIYVNQGMDAYMRYTSINKVFLGLYTTAVITGYAILGGWSVAPCQTSM